MPTAPRRTRTPLTALLLVGAVLALLFGGAGPASAHAILTRSDPADVSVLKTAPKQITLAFSESVSFSGASLRVLSPKNLRVDRGPVTHAGGKMDTARVMLAGKLPEGTYTVSWRVISADSHPVSGAFTFSIGQPSTTTAAVPTESAADTSTSRPYGFFRYVAYGGLALLIGVALFTLVCWPAGANLRPLRRLLLAGWAALFASTVVLLLLRGPYETGKGLTAMFDLSLLGKTITGRAGLALGARLVLLAAAGILLGLLATRLRRESDRTLRDPVAEPPADQPAGEPWFGIGVRVMGVLFAVGLALTWAAAEHASAGLQVPLAIPVSVLHLLAMAVWLGGLVALAVALFRAPADTVIPAAAVARFSRLAFTSVVVLVTTGLYQSWRQVGSLEALSTTEYGRLLTLKAGAVAVVLTAAWFSRQWTAQLTQEQPAETVPAAAPERVRVAQTVGVGASSGSDTAEGTDSPDGPTASRDLPDGPIPPARRPPPTVTATGAVCAGRSPPRPSSVSWSWRSLRCSPEPSPAAPPSRAPPRPLRPRSPLRGW
ncbi:copper resistance CopC/CopD family protein [Streptomyces sp. NL15-2K]|uniref:copper resistance CopC/CopD family protein n=1 Tax=Streptomyces sp. NL15-2K TaxID=376149 RepID=UPI000FF9C1F9|nr:MULTISPECIES: copper resistance protein CopC [Actinomycetes]WKX07484.1 copper resistance protein CopC [Kutzneria buriramensis]GCB51273.1 copper resistance protein D [Streptomyces sp. NL15-2K]